MRDCERVEAGKERDGEDTLDEYFLYILGPDLAGSVLEHLVMFTLGGYDGLAGGLAFCRVEGVWMIHGVGEVAGSEGREGLL